MTAINRNENDFYNKIPHMDKALKDTTNKFVTCFMDSYFHYHLINQPWSMARAGLPLPTKLPII